MPSETTASKRERTSAPQASMRANWAALFSSW